MTEELIKLDTARLAKEKGFTQNPYVILNAYLPRYTNGKDVHLNSSLYSPENNVAVAPTQSVLQKWLREEHHLSIMVTHHLSGYDSLIFESQIYQVKKHSITNTISFETYEEALEQGLIKALKLIKI